MILKSLDNQVLRTAEALVGKQGMAGMCLPLDDKMYSDGSYEVV